MAIIWPHKERDSRYATTKRDTQTFCIISHFSRPISHSTDTSRISASAFNSMSDTGRFCPSSSDSAGTLISTPASCNFANNSTCFMSFASRACVTLAPIMLRFPSANFLVLKLSPLLTQIIGGLALFIFGITKYKENNLASVNLR